MTYTKKSLHLWIALNINTGKAGNTDLFEFIGRLVHVEVRSAQYKPPPLPLILGGINEK